ncbi:hypothetical protein JYG55_23095, partial [Escherichia fergusonii]|uniref:hypothetical protein n=1 Tax=Escherichia fergusonii TaxID=564 RepID=UPI001CBAA417
LDSAEHAVLDPELAVILQEDDPVAYGKVAFAIIGLIGEGWPLIAVIALTMTTEIPCLTFGPPSPDLTNRLHWCQLTPRLQLSADPLIDRPNIDTTMRHR